jgi:TRAP-type C4-dicarboxylate transport system substrate-binding protein
MQSLLAKFSTRLAKTLVAGIVLPMLLVWQAEAAEVIRVNSVTPNNPDNIDTAQLLAFADRVKAKSNGELELEIHWSSSLVPQQQAFDAVTSGIVDANWFSANHYAGQIPETDLFALPFNFADHADFIAKMSGCIDAVLDKQFLAQGAKYIGSFPSSGAAIIMSAEKVTTKAELSGKKIRVIGPAQADFVTNLGASPVYVSFSELEVSLDRGVVDGFITGWATMATFPGLRRASKFVTWPPLQGSLGISFVMNGAKFDSLPPELQTALKDAAAETINDGPAWFAKKEGEAEKILADDGVALTEMPAAEYDSFKQASAPVWDTFVEKVSSAGGDEGKARAEMIASTLRNGCAN